MSDVIPGQMRCAKCGFVLVRNVLYMQSGTIGAGNSETEPCPNKCGPLWPMTWEQEAHDLEGRCIEQMNRATAAEADNERMRACLLAMADADDVGSGSLKTAAYDVVLNCITADVLKTRFGR